MEDRPWQFIVQRPASSVHRPAVRVSAPESQITRLDRLIHDRVRLGILSALAASSEMSFGDLKAALEVTDGNLSVHARKLEEAGYIVCRKSFTGRTPRTEYAMTPPAAAPSKNISTTWTRLLKLRGQVENQVTN